VLYPERLSELAGILDGIPWLLTGGVTIPLRLGEFYRRHGDIDVAFPVEAFADIDRAMRAAGFYLARGMPMSFFGRMRFSVCVPIRCDGWFVRHRPRKLRYLDDTGARTRPHLLTRVDAFPYRITDGRFTTLDGRYEFPLDRPLVGHRFRTAGGHEISCLDLHFVAEIKRRTGDPKHALDLSVVAHHFPGDVGAKAD